MLQEARRHGWGDAEELDAAIAAYAAFVTEHVVDADGVVRGDNSAAEVRGSTTSRGSPGSCWTPVILTSRR